MKKWIFFHRIQQDFQYTSTTKCQPEGYFEYPFSSAASLFVLHLSPPLSAYPKSCQLHQLLTLES